MTLFEDASTIFLKTEKEIRNIEGREDEVESSDKYDNRQLL